MQPHSQPPLAYIPSPSVNGIHLGPLFIHYYGLMYVIGITLAVLITQRRVRRMGGDPALVGDIALWAVPAGIIGARIYFDITTPSDIPHVWYGVFAVWSGGLGIWGGIAAGALVGAWRVRRAGASVAMFADAIAPALLVASAIGRIGNYFNQELFGRPTTLPWGLLIQSQHRPAAFPNAPAFQPTFLYELIWDLALAAFLVWLGNHRKIKLPGLFALYVAGYSAFRIFEETLRVDSSAHFLGLRTNFYIATLGTIAGLAWFVISQRRTPAVVADAESEDQAAADSPEEPADGSGAPPDASSETEASETDASETEASETEDAEIGTADTQAATSDDPVASDRN